MCMHMYIELKSTCQGLDAPALIDTFATVERVNTTIGAAREFRISSIYVSNRRRRDPPFVGHSRAVSTLRHGGRCRGR